MQSSTLPATRPPHALRWTSRSDLDRWIAAFRIYFSRKAHLAEKAAAALSQVYDIETVRNSLPHISKLNPADSDDRFFAHRRLEMFAEDRHVLVKHFRILPDAADLFLTACPVGCAGIYVSSSREGFDQSLCYYTDDQSPSDGIDAIIKQQYAHACGLILSDAATMGRVTQYLSASLLAPLFQFLGWEFKVDLDGRDEIDAGALVTRFGWVTDHELGDVECFSMPVTVDPVWCRDEVFWGVLKALLDTRDLAQRPVLVFNNRPQQLVKNGSAFTSFGFIVMRSKIVPLFLTSSGISLADTVVEAVTFAPHSASSLIDTESQTLRVIWSLLGEMDQEAAVRRMAFKMLPDNWMVPM
jgi:hypothetical protein